MLQTAPRTCYHRAYGRYRDPNDETIYHLIDNPPPIFSFGEDCMMERLVCIEEPTIGTLTERLISFENNYRALESWCSYFKGAFLNPENC